MSMPGMDLLPTAEYVTIQDWIDFEEKTAKPAAGNAGVEELLAEWVGGQCPGGRFCYFEGTKAEMSFVLRYSTGKVYSRDTSTRS
jgi:hypothetical protein